MPLGLGLQLQRLYHTKFVKGQGQRQPVVVRTVLRIGLVVYLKLRQAKGDFIDLDHQVDLLLLQGWNDLHRLGSHLYPQSVIVDHRN